MSGAPGGPFETGSSPVATAEEVAVQPAEEPLLAGLDRPLTVLVVGASGFVGSHLLQRLESRGHRVRAVSRSGEPPAEALSAGRVRWISADITRPGRVAGLAEECDVLVHLAGVRSEEDGQTFENVHVEGTANLLQEASRAGVDRFVYVSVLGASPRRSPYFRSKFSAEQLVRESDLSWVILRPSAVYGPGDHFVSAAARWLRVCPVFPVPGNGQVTLRPVAVEDMTDALCQSVERDDVGRRTYLLTGPERMGLAEAVRTVASVMGLRRVVLRVPRSTARGLLALAGRVGLPAHPVLEGWTLLARRPDVRVRVNHFRSVFHIEPLPFREALEDYL